MHATSMHLLSLYRFKLCVCACLRACVCGSLLSRHVSFAFECLSRLLTSVVLAADLCSGTFNDQIRANNRTPCAACPGGSTNTVEGAASKASCNCECAA
jgi:hypothetical protein